MSTVATLPVGAAVPSLARWGLSSDADLVFRTLITFGTRPARTLASELGLARHRVDDALAELHECGAAVATASAGRIPAWSGRPADEVVHRLRSRWMRPADGTRAVRRHRVVFDMLNGRLAGADLPLDPVLAGTVGDGVRYLPNRPVTRQRLAAAMGREQHEHLVINNEETDTPDTRPAVPFDEATYRRGVRFRILGQPPLDGDAARPARGPERRYGVQGFQYRETWDTPLKLFVCDRRTAFLPADPADVDRGYFEITQRGVIDTLVRLFESRWTSGVDPDATGVPGIALSVRENDLVRLLARGHTDVTAAQELRISARSVTNTLRALMDRLGVDNRFQLGLALGAMEVAVPPSLSDGS